jgi:NTP pyrophosphatase (non-canonical NTP hydrolase)
MDTEYFTKLSVQLRDFADRRDWQQFHSPKNLAMALIVEAAELLEEFQWQTVEESHDPEPDRRQRIEAEMADVLIYLVRLADKLDVDLPDAVQAKLVENERKYPANKVRGSAAKYCEQE